MKPFFRLGAFALLALFCQSAQAEKPVMLHVIVRNISASIKPDSFAAKPRELWRSGTNYMRVDEAENEDQHILGTILVVEPDIWMWERKSNTANHTTDQGGDKNVHVHLVDQSAPQDLWGLEIGNEVEFFKSHKAKSLGELIVDDITVTGQELTSGDTTVTLYVKKSTGLPFQVIIKDKQGTNLARYDVYEPNLPFKPELFALPKDVKVTEAPAAPQQQQP